MKRHQQMLVQTMESFSKLKGEKLVKLHHINRLLSNFWKEEMFSLSYEKRMLRTTNEETPQC